MRIGVDLDGTVADLHAALAREARDLFPGIDPADLPNSTASADSVSAATDDEQTPKMPGTALSARQQRELWAAVCARVNFWETLGEIQPGLLARLYRLSLERKWEIIFITSRPETRGDTAQLQSHRWLVKCGFSSPSVFVAHGSRGKIADALRLDVVVDDRPENCLDVAIDSSARAILVWSGDSEQVPASARNLGIGAVGSIAECVDLLERLDDGRSEGAGIVERLKNLLGLQSTRSRARERVARTSVARDAS